MKPLNLKLSLSQQLQGLRQVKRTEFSSVIFDCVFEWELNSIYLRALYLPVKTIKARSCDSSQAKQVYLREEFFNVKRLALTWLLHSKWQ